ncbi:uroporphyrinogen-III synthase [Virgibacillus sp. MG-45]|uniref:uroporphyrinogen-III synthase n=1 Tax=Virgibacillus sp. MG-45 TaxID=3102791 RepID=UPI002EDB9CE5
MTALLKGKNILVTRERNQAKEFSAKIKQCGGSSFEVPLLSIECKEDASVKHYLNQLHVYKWIFFTSANGVDCFIKLALIHGVSMDALKTLKVAVVGHKTEEAIQRYGITADFIPSVYDAEHMATEFLQKKEWTGRILLVRGNRSRFVLPHEFSHAGIAFDNIEVYDTTINTRVKSELNQLLQDVHFDFLTFTSPSTIDAFIQMIDLDMEQFREQQCVCIGTTTAKQAKAVGFKQILIPKEFTIEGMIACMNDYLNERIDSNE